MARHASPRTPTVRRALAVLATAGAALGAGAATASATVPLPPPAPSSASPSSSSGEAPLLGETDAEAGLRAVAGSVGHAAGPVAGLRPNPLAGTGVDPLDNGVGTQVADLPPLTSTALTGPVAQAESVGTIPVAGRATELVDKATRG
ncbi:hypothetical protein [Streptomyces fumanus]|uniref:ATP-binding protein n=1 Tax=Streptomyces fumanus TaxID=67302 RepID=A0A919AJE7_9ACTN|nr:hypothetical protein [Streptomyces fumanus]GHF12704.1 hypothetical protein GCM10018772_42320 [Streptomyces fumanus]